MKRQDKLAVERYLQKIELAKTAGSPNPYETKKEREARIASYKDNPRAMVEYYFPHYATSECADFQIEWAFLVRDNPIFKGFCQWGRALAKSVWNNILIPFWLWLQEEPIYLVIVGNNLRRAEQLLEDLRAEFEANPRILADFGEQMQIGSWEAGFFITKGGFIGQALGMGQSVRGLRVKNKRPTHIVPDDIETKEISKNPKRQLEMVQWILRDLIPTMDGDIRRFMQANNRFAHMMIQTILQELNPKWTVHQVNAFNPVTFEPTWHQKYSATYFKEVVDEIGFLAANAEYNNTPHVEGTYFKDEHFHWVKLPKLKDFKTIAGWWDVAYSDNKNSDYNSIIVEGISNSNKFYVIDTFCKQSKMVNAVRWMCHYQKTLPKGIKIFWFYESQFWNDEVQRIIDEVQAEQGVYLNLIKRKPEKKNKEERIMELYPYYQNNRVYYNEELKGSSDMQVGISQLKGIEPGYKTHDDWPDGHASLTKELEKFNPTRKAKNLMGKMKSKYSW